METTSKPKTTYEVWLEAGISVQERFVRSFDCDIKADEWIEANQFNYARPLFIMEIRTDGE